MKKIPMYVLTAALLVVSVYMHSALVAISCVVLWAVVAAEEILCKKTNDIFLAKLSSSLEAHEKKLDILSNEIRSVADRARTILGETF